MKKIFQYILIIALIAATGIAYYISENEPTIVEISLMKDITDSLVARPDTNGIFPLFNFGEHKWKKLRFRSQNITNYDYNPVYSCILRSAFSLLSNPMQRDGDILIFKHSIKSAVDSVNAWNGSLPNSSVYLPLIREINRLARSTAKNKILIVYSDLAENTSSFSIYRKRRQSIPSRDSLVAFFKRISAPENLKGVTIYFVYRPRKPFDHNNFVSMANMYMKLLGDAGARVYVGANIDPLN
jgi:hypothetical protein